MEGHDDGHPLSAQLDMAASLTNLDESFTEQDADDSGSTKNRKRWTHAESWKVVTIGFSIEIGSACPSK
jgi:hypothetical protein